MTPSADSSQDTFAFLPKGGEIVQLIRNVDWSRTPLGPAGNWSPSLRTTLSIVLNAKFPMGLWWGEDLIQFYNDAYRPCLGKEGKHPEALGQRGPDCWPEVWPLLKPLIEQVLSGGEATWQEDQLIPIYRNGQIEEAYWTYSYSPVRDENGKVAGVLVLCQDTTYQVQTFRLFEQRFGNFVRQAPVGIIVLKGVEMVVDVVNDAYSRLIDRSYEELIHKPLFLVIPEAQPYFHPILEKVRTSAEALFLYDHPYFVLVDGIRKEGFLDLVYQPFREPDGSISGVMVLCYEVTEKVSARKKVEESEAQFRSLIEQAPVATCLFIGRDMRIELANPTMIGYWGKGSSVIGIPLAEALPEMEGQPFLPLLDEVFTTGKTYQAQGARADLVVDGVLGTYYFDFTYKPLFTETNQVYGILEMAVDVTQQVLSYRKVEESEQLFRTFANNIQNLAWMAAAKGDIYWYNQQWYEYTGMSLEEMKGWGWEKVHHPDYLERVVTFVKEAWGKGETFELTFPLRGANGIYRWFLTRAYAVKDPEGNVIRWIGTNTDIDDRTRAEASLATSEREAQTLVEELAAVNEELRAANEEIQAANEELIEANEQLIRTNSDLDNFVYMASHDLKAPILNVEGLLKALERQLGSEIRQQERVQEIYRLLYSSIKRFKVTIEDLTEVARISKESSEDVASIAIGTVLEEVLKDLTPQIHETGTAVVVKLDSQLVHFSRKNLKSVLYNLLSNAIKYRSAERSPLVVISCHPEEGYYVLTVQDNGLGMDMRQEEKIFALFKRLHTHVEGTGIGLYIVKKMVENAGGKIQVESQIDVGSTFRVYFKRWGKDLRS